MKRLTIALLILVVGAASATAVDFFDGRKLQEYWSMYKKWTSGKPGGDPRDMGIYEGFVMGIAATQDGIMFQLPPDIGSGKIVIVVGNFLDAHSDWLGGSASSLVITALKLSYPLVKK